MKIKLIMKDYKRPGNYYGYNSSTRRVIPPSEHRDVIKNKIG